MKSRLVILGVLLAMFMILYASEDTSDINEYIQKKQKLDQLVERFKAETGFEGTIETIPNIMRFGVMKGTFSSVPIPASTDTLELRQAFEGVITTILPYIHAPLEQLSSCPIYMRDSEITTDYIQLVNGYRIQSAGFIRITINTSKMWFILSDSTISVTKDHIKCIISADKAKSIALKDYISGEPYPEAHHVDVIEAFHKYSLVYSNRYTSEYTLVYIVSMNNYSYTYYIDAQSGEIIYREPTISIE